MSSPESRPTTHIPVDNAAARPTTDFQPAPPTETAPATQVTTPTQQAATQPGAGGVQHVVVESGKPSFGQQVVGYAKEIRGTVLRKPETKDYGNKLRKGEEQWPPQQQDGEESASAGKP